MYTNNNYKKNNIYVYINKYIKIILTWIQTESHVNMINTTNRYERFLESTLPYIRIAYDVMKDKRISVLFVFTVFS